MSRDLLLKSPPTGQVDRDDSSDHMKQFNNGLPEGTEKGAAISDSVGTSRQWKLFDTIIIFISNNIINFSITIMIIQ